jgi:uncharacterized RDD family membrane protein YckC
MTQPPDNMGGQPAADGSPGDQDNGSPAPAPPPGAWHFPPEPAPPPAGPQGQQSYGGPPPPYGTSPQYGSPQPYGSAQQAGGPPQYGGPQQHGGPPQQYGGPQPQAPPTQPYGAQQPYGPPQQPYGGPPQQYGGPPQQYGAPPQQYGAPPQQYGGPPPPYGAQPQPYGTPYGAAYPSYGAGSPPGPEPGLAEWWRRLLGRIIDTLIVGVVVVLIAIPLLSGPFHRFQQVSNLYPDLNTPGAQAAISKADGKLFVAVWILSVIGAVIWFLYDSLQHAKWGQTIGKRALSTRVVSAYDRSPISGAAAAKRAAVYALIPVIPLLGGIFAIINELWLLWDRRRQCLHDKAAHTIVIRTDVPVAGNWQQGGAPW